VQKATKQVTNCQWKEVTNCQWKLEYMKTQ